MAEQIQYYELDAVDAASLNTLLKHVSQRMQAITQNRATKSNSNMRAVVDAAFASSVFNDLVIRRFLLHLCRLPVFSRNFQQLFQDRLWVLTILKKLKYFINLKVAETLYLLRTLSSGADNCSAHRISSYFAEENHGQVHFSKMKFRQAIHQGVICNDKTRDIYEQAFEELERVEPHAVYATSIYRQSDGHTLSCNHGREIEASMSTILTTSIRVESQILAFDNPLLAQVYRPHGRVVMIADDKLTDEGYTAGLVDKATNRRVEAQKNGMELLKLNIAQQAKRYFEYHCVSSTVLEYSGNEVDKDIEQVQKILIELKQIGVCRNEPVLIVGGGVISDIAGFACALYHRNTPYVMLATSIVAGIDAGPSPRTCCDGQGFKNAFGAFHPPVLTLTDRSLWGSIHPGMIRHGVAEIIKMAVVENRQLFELLEKVSPTVLLRSKFGTVSAARAPDTSDEEWKAFNGDCERIIGMAMESYVRAEYGNLWETHQCRPHAYGHTFSPGYELLAGMLHGHAVATCMGFGAFLAYRKCKWITLEMFTRICALINSYELALWHEIMEEEETIWQSTVKIIEKRGGNLCAPIPKGAIGKCGYLNDLSRRELSQFLKEYKHMVTETLGLARQGRGVQMHLTDVGLGDTKAALPSKHECNGVVKNNESSYAEWIQSVQTARNKDWEFNVRFETPVDTKTPPKFVNNTLFYNNVAEDYAMAHTSLVSKNTQTAARFTRSANMFAPCMVGSIESQFLKMFTKAKKARFVLDIGTFTGMSAIAFAEGLYVRSPQDPATVYTVENDEKIAQAAAKVFASCDDNIAARIKLHYGNAAAYMKELGAQGQKFDIIFLDADKENYITYYDLAMEGLLNDDGVILADNSLCALLYDESDERRVALHQFNQHVKNDKRVEQVVLTVREGITMISRC